MLEHISRKVLLENQEGKKVPIFHSSKSLDIYIIEVFNIPILKPEEEKILTMHWHRDRNRNAANQLVSAHLRLVVKMAKKYQSYGLQIEDLISEGNLGLMKALEKFDPDRGFRFSTYARWWIKAALIDYVLRSWSMVKLGTWEAQKKLFFRLRYTKARLNITDDLNLSSEQLQILSEETNCPPEQLIQMNSRIMFRDTSLNTRLSSDQNSNELQDLLVDKRKSQEDALGEREERELRKRIVLKAISELPERERHILQTRRLYENKLTLDQLGSQFGISKERVRQLEVKAFDKIKSTVLSRLATDTGEGSHDPTLPLYESLPPKFVSGHL